MYGTRAVIKSEQQGARVTHLISIYSSDATLPCSWVASVAMRAQKCAMVHVL